MFPGFSEATTVPFLKAGKAKVYHVKEKAQCVVSRSAEVSLHSSVWKEEQDMHGMYPQATSPIWLEFVMLLFNHTPQVAPLHWLFWQSSLRFIFRRTDDNSMKALQYFSPTESACSQEVSTRAFMALHQISSTGAEVL